MSLSTEAPEVEASVARLAAALTRAVADYGTPAFRRLQQAGMRVEVGWAGPAGSWEAFLREVAASDTDMSEPF